MGARDDPYGAFRFRLLVEGAPVAAFAGAQLPAGAGQGPLRLSRGVTVSSYLDDWRLRAVEAGRDAPGVRRAVVLVMTDLGGGEGARWEALDAWPVRYEAAARLVSGDATAIEALELDVSSLRPTS